MECKYCHGPCVKAGLTPTQVQRYHCKKCCKYQQRTYSMKAYHPGINSSIASLLTEGMGIRSMARILKISATTVISRIKAIAGQTTRLPCSIQATYEIDELWTFVKSKRNPVWITYALDRLSGRVAYFVVGTRTSRELSQVTTTTLALSPKHICTDGLAAYRSLVPRSIHQVGLPYTRRIERFNLTLRTHLKRLHRKTICFSKSTGMLESCLKIYFWSAHKLTSSPNNPAPQYLLTPNN
jgi:insertion element IS1 protein InsB